MVEAKLRELAERTVSNMGDVFYEPDEWGDYSWGLDSSEDAPPCLIEELP